VSPLRAAHTFTEPEDVLRFRSALGHFEQNGRWEAVTQWGLPRSCGPAGLICATAADVVAFARMHIDGGMARDGTRVLSTESVAAMRESHVAVPDPFTMGTHFGLAWVLFDGDTKRVYGHNGGTVGQAAFLRVVPDAKVAIALLTNGGHVLDLYESLVAPMLQELTGVTVPSTPEPATEPVDGAFDQHVGVYQRLASRIEIDRRESGLVARLISTGPLAEVFPEVPELKLVPAGTDRFVTRQEGEDTWSSVVFYRLSDGTPYVHFALRATPKVS
jgi:CubicO group peptidase (beta-lactamase class C family)